MLKVIFAFIFYVINTQANEGMSSKSMDERVSVPMLEHMANHQKQNMREHLESVQGIIAGLAKKDFKAIEIAASQMGYTPEMGKMCERMGSAVDGFSERAIAFHKSADKISAFARAKNEAEVLNSLNQTLTQCTSCHSMFKQQIVNETTFKSLSDSSLKKRAKK